MTDGNARIVSLSGLSVGLLADLGDESSAFSLLDSYKTLPRRPVLGQTFEDDPDGRWRSRVQVPAWFSNLLPEGKLRRTIARELGVNDERELPLLDRLGADLPGAVVVSPALDDKPTADARWLRDYTNDEAPQLSFSLAGVQPKLSGNRRGERIVMPMRGQSGHWIVKLPMAGYPGLTRWEHTIMDWAQRCGLDVPEHDLRPASSLPDEVQHLLESQEDVYLIRRFDRRDDETRVHFEDFAQITNQYPTDEGKYKKLNYSAISRLVRKLCGEEAQRAFAERLVFVLLSGNGDAHAKNWAILYADGVQASLAPVYDQVPTVLHPALADELALNLTKRISRDWRRIGHDAWAEFGVKGELSGAPALLNASIDRFLGAWRSGEARELLTSGERTRLYEHWKKLPILWGRALPDP